MRLQRCLPMESVHLVSLCRWPSRGSRSNVLAFLVIPLIWTSIPNNLPEGPWGRGAVAIVPVHSWLLKCGCLQYVCRSMMTVYFTRRSHNKCFNNICLCEVEVICVSYSWSVVWVEWVEHQKVPWDLKSQSCGFRRWKHCLQCCECLLHCTTRTAC